MHDKLITIYFWVVTLSKFLFSLTKPPRLKKTFTSFTLSSPHYLILLSNCHTGMQVALMANSWELLFRFINPATLPYQNDSQSNHFCLLPNSGTSTFPAQVCRNAPGTIRSKHSKSPLSRHGVLQLLQPFWSLFSVFILEKFLQHRFKRGLGG